MSKKPTSITPNNQTTHRKPKMTQSEPKIVQVNRAIKYTKSMTESAYNRKDPRHKNNKVGK